MYRLLRFIDNETNTAPDYEVVLELDKFKESDEILNKFIKVCKEKNLPYSDGYYDYMVIEYACEVPIKAESVFYYKDKESAFDGVEWDGRVIASSALGYDFTDQNYLEITNNVTDKGYIQWLEEFVKAVITKAKLKCSEIIIDDIEWNRNIFLNIDGHEYDIRTWSFIPSEEDEKGHTCAESVSYTLFNDFNKTGGIVGKIQNAFVGSNFEQMKKDEKSYSDKIDMSYNSELDNYIKSLGAKQVISDRGSYFELNGALEEVYEKMQSIQEVANQLGEDKYANILSDQINDAQELTDKYKDMYDAYVLYEQVLKDTDYSSAYQKAMSDYQNYL